MATPQSPKIDDVALAKQFGGVVVSSRAPAGKSTDEIELAKQFGGTVVSGLKAKKPGEPGTPWTPPGDETPGPWAIGAGLKETLVPFEQPSDIWQGPAYAVRHPIKAAKLVGGSILESHVNQIKEGLSDFRRATSSKQMTIDEAMGVARESFGHFLAAAVPVIGPAAARAAENLKKPETFWQGVGDTIGLLLPFGLGEAGKRVKPQKATGPVPLLRSERTGGTISRWVESVGERSLTGSGVFQDFRAKQQSVLIDRLATQAVKRISTYEGTAEQLGVLVKRDLENMKASLKEAAGMLYGEVDEATKTTTQRVPQTTTKTVQTALVDARGKPLTMEQVRRTMVATEVGGVQPSTAVLKRVAIPILRRLRQEAKLIPPGELQRSVSMLERIISAPKQLPFKAFQDARSDLLAIVRAHDDPIPGKTGGLARKLAASTDAAMMTAAENSGIPGLADKVRMANALWKEAATIFNESVVTKILESSPEKILPFVQSATLDDLRQLREVLPASRIQDIKAALVQGIVQNAIKDKPHILIAGSNVIPGIEGKTFQKLHGNLLTQGLKKLGPRAEALLAPNELSELYGLAELANRVEARGSTPMPTLIVGAMNVELIMGSLWAIGRGDYPLLAYHAGAAGGLHVLARLMIHTEGFPALRKFVRAVSAADKEQAQYWGMRINQLVAESPTASTQGQAPSPPSPPPPKPVAPSTPAAVAAAPPKPQAAIPPPPEVQEMLKSGDPGTYTLSDGTKWMKDANGLIHQVQQ